MTPSQEELLQQLHDGLVALGYVVERQGDTLTLGGIDNKFTIDRHGRLARSFFHNGKWEDSIACATVEEQLFWCAQWLFDDAEELAQVLG